MCIDSRLIFGLIWFCFLGYQPVAVAQMVQPEALTIDDGLSQGMIYDLLQTRDGFLWIATKDGLNRYDGYNFKVYTHAPNDPFSLPENTVTALLEDSRGLLWIGSENKGINLLDRRTGRFLHLNLPIKKGFAGLSFEVRRIVETPDGAIWIAQTGNGVSRIQIPESWRSQLPDQPVLDGLALIQPVLKSGSALQPDTLPENFGSLSLLPDGNLLASSNKYLYQVDHSTLRMEVVPLSLPPVSSGQDQLATSLYASDGAIWVSGDDYVQRLKNGQVDNFKFPGIVVNTKVWTDHAGNHWLMVENKIWRLTADCNPHLAPPDFIVDQNAACVNLDRNNNIWIGTRGYGLRKFNPQKRLFHAGAQGKSIYGLWEDGNGQVYAKIFSTIFRYNTQTQRLDKQTAFPDAPNRQMDLWFSPEGDRWLLGGIQGENTASQLRFYPRDGSPARSFGFSHAVYPYTRLWHDQQGSLWITGNGCQLLRFDPRNSVFTPFNFDGLFPENAKATQAFAIVTDGRGDLWLGTQNGLVRGVRNGEKIDFQLFRSEAGNTNSLSFNFISCLLPDPADPSNVIWIGTKGGGINRFDFQHGQFLHYTTANGLPNNVVYGILPDEAGHLWCSTNRGIVRLAVTGTPDALLHPQATVFTASEGLQSSEFNTQAFGKSPGGALLFGGVNGLNRFFPNELNSKAPAPSVFVVGLEINHRKVSAGEPGYPFSAPLEYLSQMELDYDQNNISFEFAALDFNDPSKNRYRYQLVGLEKDWVEAGANHFAHYTHLPPGHYVFQVIGGNGNGAWNETPVTIHIVVRPPWWRSDLAWVAYFLLFAGAVWWVYRFQINRIRFREQLAFEQREIQRVRALEQMKTNFFANVTHEFRTPLTLMLEPVRQLLQNPQDPLLVDKLQFVDRSSHKLLELVNQLLDLAKLESGGMGLDLRHGDLSATVHGIFHSFLPSAKQKGIQLKWSAPDALPPFLFDSGKVEQVLNNLIANALKFTPQGGTIEVTVNGGRETVDGGRWTEDGERETVGGERPVVSISVRDTGIGIPAEALDKIFDRFYQVEGAHQQSGEGTGIGLALSKELVQLMGGEIGVESKEGQGSCFTFWIPKVAGEKPTAEFAPTFSWEEPLPARDETERPLVLIIEDHAELRAFIRQSVSDRWQVAESPNGEEGIRKALELVPDLIISDLMMPGKDGYQVCDELKNQELTAHIPIILLTAKAALDARIKGLRAGADDYLTKPFNADELRARMDNLATSRRKLRERYEQRHVNDGAVHPTASEDALTAPDQSFIRRFTETIEAHLDDETLGVEEFAGKMFISRVQLHRKLKGLTGRSATEFIRDYRLDRAMALLQNREGGVAEIAMRVGFGNEKYFSTVFKEKFGVSPSQIG